MLTQNSHGVINYDGEPKRKNDYLYRVSLKCLVWNARGEVLVVKEAGRDWWDLPGGGMDHGEDIRSAIAREMKEEVNLESDFDYKIIAIDEPVHLDGHNCWQIRLIFEVKPKNMTFSAGEDSDEVAFMDASIFKNSLSRVERQICSYADHASR